MAKDCNGGKIETEVLRNVKEMSNCERMEMPSTGSRLERLCGPPTLGMIRRRRAFEALCGLPSGSLDNSLTLPFIDRVMADETIAPDYLTITRECSL